MKIPLVLILAATFILIVFLPFWVLSRMQREQVTLIILSDSKVCIEEKPERVDFSYIVFVEKEDRSTGVTGLIFTACIKHDATVDRKLIDNAYEVAKEVVYRRDEKRELKTVDDIKAVVADTLIKYMNGFSQYAGKISFKVETIEFDAEAIK